MTAPAPDPAAALATVGWSAVGAPEPVAGGWDTFLWRFAAADGRDHALRMHRPGNGTPERQAWVARKEGAAIRACAEAGLPVAAIEAEGAYDGVPFAVQPWLPGVTLTRALERRPWQVWKLGREFGRMQARLHRLKPDDLPELQPEHWVGLVDHAALTEAAVRLAQPAVLCHLDFHPNNVLVERGRITGVVDFTNACIADPAYDLARTRTLLLHGPLKRELLTPAIQQLRKLLARAWASGYRAEAGALPRSAVFEAVALGVLLHDVRKAVAEGRGWATLRDVADLERMFRQLLRAAGIED
ncbi:MAG: phosphotransferase enzyme family protein [Hyphomicrobiales bacterium]